MHPIFGTPLPADWQLLRVDDIKSPDPGSCVAGPFGSNISSKYFADQGIPVIRGGNLTDDLTQFVPNNFVFVSEERAQSYKPQHVKAGDLVFTCWGTIGQVGRIPNDGPYPEYIISNKQLKLRPDPTLADSQFLYYYFANPRMVEYIKSRAVGSAVPGINLGILKSFPVALPPLAVQCKIAAILSGYDELIENNGRRIKILEEMAQRIYREWFVDFRYPGHEVAQLTESRLALVPLGWQIKTLSDIVTTQYGYTESASTEPIGPKFLRGMDINKSSFIDWSQVPYCRIHERDRIKYRLRVGDILVIRMADPGKVGIVESNVDAVFASYLIRLRPRDDSLQPYFLFYFLLDEPYQKFVNGASTGTTRKSLSAPGITSIELALPPTGVQSAFVDYVRPVRSLLSNLVQSSAQLRLIRDLLLPRLISGEVDVDDLDIRLPEAA